MKVIRAKLAETPKTCKCGGKIVDAVVRKQKQVKCNKCGERVSELYEERIGSIKRLVEEHGKELILFVVEDDKKASKKSTDLVGETLELGDKYLIVIDKNGHCKVEEVKKNEGFKNIKSWEQFVNETVTHKLQVVLDYWDRLKKTKQYASGGYYQDQSSEITRQETITGDSEIEIFEKFYKLNNSLRYCNGSYYEFQDKDWKNKYQAWLKSDDYKKKSFDLYYGGGVVD